MSQTKPKTELVLYHIILKLLPFGLPRMAATKLAIFKVHLNVSEYKISRTKKVLTAYSIK